MFIVNRYRKTFDLQPEELRLRQYNSAACE